MKGFELKRVLGDLSLSQSDFARLLNVTTRAITLWLADERAVPGPVEGYLRLFRLLPPNLRQIELNRLKEKGTSMRDGIFKVDFVGNQGGGMAMLIFENGRVYGTDTEGVRYDGEYVYREEAGLADVKVKVTFPPNVKAVFGVSNPYEWSFDVTTSLNPAIGTGSLALKTSLGQPIKAKFTYLRSLPEAA